MTTDGNEEAGRLCYNSGYIKSKKMAETINLTNQIEKQLPAELVEFMQVAGLVASKQGQKLYLVGGVVRDLLLRRGNLDLDLVVEGNAINLAQRLADTFPGEIVTHPRFNTAKLKWNNWSIDLATARSETYAKPGALPAVKPGSLPDDLFRRDFTINSMATELIPSRYGQLIDLYGGRNDLERKLIRILHERSFIDDATRIWRALRYEQRLDFQLEPDTLELLKRDIPVLDTISSDRIRHELELILKEECPEKVICRADELGVLPELHPALKGDYWLADKFGQAHSSNLPLSGLYMALLAYRLTNRENEELISRLRVSKPLALTLRDGNSLKAGLDSLADPELPPSRIYSLLHEYSPTAITANALACHSPTARQHMQTFLTKLRYVKPALTGNDLKKMGIAPGPQMKEILRRLHETRLNGKVKTKQGEKEMVEGWIASFPTTPPA
ncbi:CCA tRNA nucleotidyltransferase [Chloroflexota bacterium]